MRFFKRTIFKKKHSKSVVCHLLQQLMTQIKLIYVPREKVVKLLFVLKRRVTQILSLKIRVRVEIYIKIQLNKIVYVYNVHVQIMQSRLNN